MPKPLRKARKGLDNIDALIINLSPWTIGGFTAVTAHSYLCLQAGGLRPKVLRLNLNKTEGRERATKLGIPYHNYSVEDALPLVRNIPTLVTGVARSKDLGDPDTILKLMDAGARVVVHGYTEHKQFEHIEHLKNGVCIRQSMRGVYGGADDYLIQPYFRCKPKTQPLKKRKRAGCTAMVVRHKNPHIILEANRLITRHQRRIQFRGGEDRMFAKYTIQKKYPEYELGHKFPTGTMGAEICKEYQFMVDLTVFEKGNGGSQYCFMEAMDAGCVLVIHKHWLQDQGDMAEGVNCLAIETSEELAELVGKANPYTYTAIVENGFKFLRAHGPTAFTQSFNRLFS